MGAQWQHSKYSKFEFTGSKSCLIEDKIAGCSPLQSRRAQRVSLSRPVLIGSQEKWL